MKKLILLLLLIPSFLVCQIQVSDIKNDLPRDDYGRKGFIKVDDKEYFIEQGFLGTRVSLVSGTDLQFLHELNHRPTDSSFNPYAASYENSNSGLIYNGSVLYDIYWDYIYAVDIISGALIEVVDLKQYNLRLQRDFYYGEDFFHFRALGIGWSGYIRLDRNTGEIVNLEDDGIVVDSKRYYSSEDGNTLFYYDLIANQNVEHPHQFTNIESIEKHDSDNDSQLIIEDEEGVHLLKTEGTVQSLNCAIPENGVLGYVSDIRISYSEITEFGLDFKVIDLSSCSEVFSMFFDNASHISNFSYEGIFNEYFIFGFTNSWYGDGAFYLYDIESDTASAIDILIDYPHLAEAVRYDNDLYFIGYNDIHYIGWLPELYRLDLSTSQADRISDYEIFETSSIMIGESQNDQELNIHYGQRETSTLRKSDTQSAELTVIEDFDILKNHGINYSIYGETWVDDKLFFYASNGLYCMHDDMTTKIDIGSNTHGVSTFIRKGDQLLGFVGLDDSGYLLRINIEDLSFTKTLMPALDNSIFKWVTSGNGFVNLQSGISISSFSSKGFFDIDTEEYITFESLGLPIGTPEFVSGNNVLHQSTSDDGYKWYLINTLTREITLTTIKPSAFSDPYPDGVGGFYLKGWNLDEEISFMYLDIEGNVSEIYQDFDYNAFTEATRFDGNVKSSAFENAEEMIIISTRDGEVKRRSIPIVGLYYYQRFFWYESDQVSFVEAKNGLSYDTYLFSFDAEPQKITISGREERLMKVLEEETFSILIYKDVNNKLFFEKYDYATEEFTVVNEIQSVRNSALGSSSIKLDETYHLFSIHDGVTGLEPWLFNVNNGELKLLADINQGAGSSSMNDFTINPNTSDLYFTAIKTEGDRQLFRLDQSLIATEELNTLSEFNLTAFPNPASHRVQLDEDFEELILIGINGSFVSKDIDHSSRSISVSDLENGVYYLLGKTESGQWKKGKVVIHR